MAPRVTSLPSPPAPLPAGEGSRRPSPPAHLPAGEESALNPADQTPQSAIRNPQSGGRRAWLLRIGGLVVFLVLLGWLEWRGAIKLEEVGRVLAGAALWPVALSVGIYFPFVLIKSERWRGLLRGMGVALRPVEAWRLYSVGLGVGALTPGQAGD